jgi:hypothetical protein
MNKLFFVLLLFPLFLNAINYEITVPANVEWFNSEIELYENEFVSIESEGVWQYDPRPNFRTGPEGLLNGSVNLGSLLMKCNDETYLVEKKWEGIIEQKCILMFGMYDNIGHSNNVGSLNVFVDIERESENENEFIDKEIEEEEKVKYVIEGESENEIPYENEICSMVIFLILISAGVLYVKEK